MPASGPPSGADSRNATAPGRPPSGPGASRLVPASRPVPASRLVPASGRPAGRPSGRPDAARRLALLACAALAAIVLGACDTAGEAGPAGAENYTPRPTLTPLYNGARASATAFALTIEPLLTPIDLPSSTPRAVALPGETSTPTPESPEPTTGPPVSPTMPPPAAGPVLHRLTAPGCCTRPFWAPDGHTVLVVDRPAPDRPLGLWGYDALAAEPTPVLYSTRLATLNTGGAFWVFPDDHGLAVIERIADGTQWHFDTGGNRPQVDPSGTRIAWADVRGDGAYDLIPTSIYAAELNDPGSTRLLLPQWGGWLVGWLDGGRSVLAYGRPSLASHDRELRVLPVDGSPSTLLLREERATNMVLSPDGLWVAVTVNFSSDPARDGVWLLATSGAEPRKLLFYGAYQWRDPRRLVYVPLRAGAAESHVFYEYDVLARTNRALTDPARDAFVIAANDWSVSPDGRRVAFVDSRDRAVWVADLGP